MALHSSRWALLKWAAGFLFVAILAFSAGGVVFVGPPLVSLAPDLLLLGGACGATFAARSFTERPSTLRVVFLLALLTLGLNTRIPALLSDLLSIGQVHEEFGDRQDAGLSQPLRVVNGSEWINARRFAYASALPSCHGDGCFVTKGLRTPLPHHGRDYWFEQAESAVLNAGFTLAGANEQVPVLTVDARKDGTILTLDLKLVDRAGALISSASYRYRSGFPGEPADDSKSVNATNNSAKLVSNFLFHGNLVNRVIGRLVAGSPEFPVKAFLTRSFAVRNSQILVSGTTDVALEVLGEDSYEPPLFFKGEDRESAKDPWPEKGWDAERTAKCDKLLRRESPHARGGTTQVWWLFVHDVTARNKIRLTGNELCEDDAVWSFDYVGKRPRIGVKKYRATGELQYDLALERLAPIRGFSGRIRQRTFHEREGYVYFEWMDADHRGFDLYVRRNLSVRFALPPTSGTDP